MARYEGPRCYVCQNEYAPRPKVLGGGHRLVWEKGWHYSTKINRQGFEVPDKKLHLNDSDPDEANWFYELADKTHKSWHEKRGDGNHTILEAP